MVKVNFINQAESFMSGSYKVRYLWCNGKKNSGKKLNKIETRLAERKQKMNSLKIKC